MAAQYVIAGPT